MNRNKPVVTASDSGGGNGGKGGSGAGEDFFASANNDRLALLEKEVVGIKADLGELMVVYDDMQVQYNTVTQ